MSPLYVGDANSTTQFLGIGQSPERPIENDTHAATWAATVSNNEGLAYVKISSMNGGAPFQIFSKYHSSEGFFCLAARWAGGDNNISNSGSTKFRWAVVKNPNYQHQNTYNDWGIAEHVFNETVDFSNSSDPTQSARTIMWNHTCQKTMWIFKNCDQTSDLVYNMAHNESMGQRMVSRGPDTGNDYFKNGAGGIVAGTQLINNLAAGSKVDSSFDNLYAGVSDGEAADAGSNDVCMLFFDNDNQFNVGLGLGWKRSGADSQYARAGGNSGQDPTFDTTDNNADSGGNYAGVLCENSSNGDMRNNADGVVSCLVKAF